MSLVLALALLAAPAMDPLVEKGFDHFYNLEYPQALADFQKALAEKPNDPNRLNHVAQTVLFQMMFRAGALESQMVTGSNPFLRRPKMQPTAEEQKLFFDSINKCLSLTDALLRKNPDDANALYARGVAFGFRGTFNFLVRRAWLDSLRDITQARKLHNRVSELEPSNIDARMMQGVHDYIVGSLPWGYRLLGFLAGFRGDREEGIKTLRLVAEKGVYNKVDAQILLGVIDRREKHPELVVPILEELRARYPRNFLVLFEAADVYADLGQKAKSLAALDEVEKLKRSGAPGFVAVPYERIEYARGNLLFWYNEQAAAIPHLRRASAGADKLDPYTGSMSWLRLGQCLDLTGHHNEARTAYDAAVHFEPETEASKQARRYIDSGYTREMYRKDKS
jgi:tetratricopeptide (TPR) repeat protein